MKNKNWTPVDAFVTEYGFRTNATFTYQPGSGEATMNTGRGMDLDNLKALIKSIEHHELQINIDGKIFVYDPEEHGEKPMKPEIEEPIKRAREAMDETLDASQTDEEPEAEEIPEAVEEPEAEEEEIVVIIE